MVAEHVAEQERHTAADGGAVSAGADGHHRLADGLERQLRLVIGDFRFLLLPPGRRRAIHAVYAFSRAVDDVADDPALSPSDPPDWRPATSGNGAPEMLVP